MTLNEKKTADVKVNGTVWFLFTPEETGSYVFTSATSLYDPRGTLYVKGGDNKEQIAYDDDSGSENNFKITVDLEAGTTYYLAVTGPKNKVCYCWVTVKKHMEVASVKLEQGTARTTYYSGGLDDLGGVSYTGAKLKVQYKDNTSEEYEVNSYAVKDNYENMFYIWCTDGEKNLWISEDNPFKNGTYRVYVQGYLDSGYDINVISSDFSKIPSVSLGENTIGIRRGNYVWYKYVPEDSACYELGAHFTDNGDEYSPSIEVMTIVGDSIKDSGYWLNDENDFDGDGWQLFADQTYFIGVCNKTGISRETTILNIERVDLEGCDWMDVGEKAPTCTTDGKKVELCTIHPGETRTTVLPATGKHTYSWKVTKPATIFAAGVRSRICSECGAIEATEAIPKLSSRLTLSVASKKSIPLKVKQSYTVKIVDIASSDRIVSWTSGNPKVATVKNGKITGKKAGTAKITVKLASGYTTWFKVKVQRSSVRTSSLKVTNKATGAKIAKTVTLNKKAKLSLSTAVAPVTSKEKVTYKTSNKKVATVSSKGVITAKKKGTATITVKSGSKSVKIKVKVK